LNALVEVRGFEPLTS